MNRSRFIATTHLAFCLLTLGASCSDESKLFEQGAAEVKRREPRSNWPGLFGPFNDSKSSEDASQLNLDWSGDGPPVKWRRAIGSGYSSPVVYGERLIVFHRRGEKEILECLNAETGEPQWIFERPATFQDRWHYSSGPYSTPVIDGKIGRVYAVGAAGRFSCVDLKTGRRIWERALHEEYTVPQGMFAVGASPLLVDDLLIFNLGAKTDNAGVLALDQQSGQTVWTATDHGAGLATPRLATFHGERFALVFTQDGLVCLKPETGDVQWTETFRANNPENINATSPLVKDDLVLISAYMKGSLCLRVLPNGQRETVWKTRRDFQSQYSTLIEVGGFVYGFHALDRTFRCLHLSTGKLQWKWPPAGEEGISRGSAMAVGNRLILFGEYGKLASLEINSHQPVVKAMTGKPLLKRECFSSPALANGLLYLRNDVEMKTPTGEKTRRGEVICLDLRGTGHPAADTE